MFSTFTGFFSVFIPLVILAVVCIIFEEKLIDFEQKAYRVIKTKTKKALKKGGQNNA